MKTTTLAKVTIGVLLALSTQLMASTNVKTLRATELTPEIWAQFDKGETQELIVEFQAGDKLPVNLEAQGELIQTTQSNPSYVTVQRDFWVKMNHNNLQMSLDGTTFKPFKKLVTGSLSVGATSETSGGIANAINIGIKAKLK